MEPRICPNCQTTIENQEDLVQCPNCNAPLDYSGLPWYLWVLLILTGPLIPFIYWLVQRKKKPIRAKYAGYIAIAMLILNFLYYLL